MPTKRHRITFTPDESTLRAVERISAATREPVSSIVAEAMTLVTEHLSNLAEMLEHTQALTADAKLVMVAAADDAANQLRPHVEKAQSVLADLAARIAGDAAMLPGFEPPSSNTGVTGSRNPPALSRRKAA